MLEYQNDSCLVLDTSNQWILLGIQSQAKWQSCSLEAPRRCFQILPDLIRKLCQDTGLERPDWLVCTIGPGSFTGARLGVAFARNLAQLWQVPVMGIVSLEFYAYELLARRPDLSKAALMLDAKQQRIYGTSLSRENMDNFKDTRKAPASKKSGEAKEGKETFPLVDQEPALFLASIGAEYQVFADEPQLIASYSKTQIRLQNKIEKMSTPDPRCLYELALKKGGRKAASKWAELKPLYLRSMPAQKQ